MSSGIEAPVAIPDLTDPRTFADAVPHAAFAEIRKLPGLYWQPTDVGVANGGFWAVTRFADIQAIEKDTESFTSTRGGVYPGTNREPGKATTSDNLMLTDPPRHSRLRRAAAKGFSPRVVANFDSWVREIVREVVDTIEGKDEFDWVQEVAMTVPARVLARILGTPAQDTPRLVDWTIKFFATAGRTDLQPGESVEQRMWAVMSELAVYAEQLQEVKRKNPADDMFTELTGCVDRGEITQNEFRMWMAVLMMAGFETTHTAIGQSMRMFLEDPEIAERTRRAVAEGLSVRAVDEYLRLISPPMEMARTATKDLEFNGQQIREGDVMVLYFVAANRDPAVFSRPNEFDPWRVEQQTLAFGSGVHRCIGAPLAKLEVQVVLEEFLSRGRGLRLNGEPKRGWSIFINQLTALPVAWV